jgi:hypothetical protein
VEERRAAGGLRDRRRSSIQIVTNLAGREPQEVAVAVTVEADLMAGSGDLGRERASSLDLLAGEEEGRPRTGVRERLEHRGGPSRVRAVVEREGDSVQPAQPGRDPQRTAQ